MTPNLEEALKVIPFGSSLDFRRSESGWPAPWRFRVLPNKNERADYRVTGYGATPRDAVANALAKYPEG